MQTREAPARAVYAYAADPEASVPTGGFLHDIHAELRRHTADGAPRALAGTAGAWADAERARFRALLAPDAPEGHRDELVRRAVLGCAPLSLASGAWLQWLSAPGNAEEPVVLRILALYASDVGVGHPEASRGSAFLALLRRLRLAENAVPTARLTTDPRVPEGAFALPALLLAMSRRPDEFRGELLGADLCLRAVGLLPALAMVRDALPTSADWASVDPSLPRGPEDAPPLERCLTAVDELLALEGERARLAVRAGFGWTLGALRAWSDTLHTELVAAADPAYAMAELMRARAREGAVYHHGFLLEGRPLAAWLADARTDPAPLLDLLAASKLIKPGRSQASPLVRGLISERGPMFRVFSPEDLTVIRRWIDSLPPRPVGGRGGKARGEGETQNRRTATGTSSGAGTDALPTASPEAAAPRATTGTATAGVTARVQPAEAATPGAAAGAGVAGGEPRIQPAGDEAHADPAGGKAEPRPAEGRPQPDPAEGEAHAQPGEGAARVTPAGGEVRARSVGGGAGSSPAPTSASTSASASASASAKDGTGTPSGSSPKSMPTPDTPRLLARVATGLRAGHPDPGRAPADIRDAYHLLMRRTDTPALREWAMEYVAGWLARSRYGMGKSGGPLPGRWGREGLRPWLQAQHDRHGAEFAQNAAVPLPSREAVVDDTVQTAPLTLIDGSWLQGFTDYEQASSAIGHSLFETYWDELGNGEPPLNHPLIYREVLKEMDVDLPPTNSPEFARWPGFRDESFELPVYWLCVGRFPQTFLPEVLGLNLAMELSGVGGTYRRARLALKEYGFSTRFVDIHNTIDNVATGHSAWAADAVDTLLAALPEAPGPGNRAETWDRVRTGYRSLNPPSGVGARLMARLAGRRR